MAIDLGQTGGARRSSSQRAGGANLQTPGTRVTRVDTARAVSEPGGFGQAAAISAVGQSLSAFFPALQQFDATDQAEEMDKIAQENTREIQRIETQVRTDPEGAREAMATGDFAKFIPEDEFRRRRVIGNTFKSLVAQQMANEDYEAGLMDAIMDVPMDGDPDQVVADFIKAQTQDSDPVFSQVYGRTIGKRAHKQISQFKQKRLESQQSAAIETARVTVRNQVQDGTVSATLGGLNALYKQAIGTIPANGPAAFEIGRATVQKSLIDLAASGEKGASQALKLIETPDPDNNGLKIKDLPQHKGAYEKAVKSYANLKEAARTQKAHSDAEALEERITLFSKGFPNENDSLPRLLSDVRAYGGEHGKIGLYDKLLKSLPKVGKAHAVATDNYIRAAKGELIRGSAKDRNQFLDNKQAAIQGMVQAGGLSEAAANTRYVQAVAQAGSSPNMKTNNSNILLSSSNADEWEKTYSEVKTYRNASRGGNRMNHLTDDGNALQIAMEQTEKSGGMDAVRVFRTQYIENAAKIAPGQTSDYFYRQLSRDGKISSGTKRLADEELRKAWGRVDAKELTGLLTPNFLGIDRRPSYTTEMPQLVKDRLHQAANLMAVKMANDPNVTKEKIADAAVLLVKDTLTLAENSEGDKYVAFNNAPTLVKGRDGQVMPGPQITAETYDRARESLKKTENATSLAAINGPVGFAPDGLTAGGHGLAVTKADAAGGEQPVTAEPGVPVSIPSDQVKGDDGGFFARTKMPNGTTVLTPPPIPTGDAPTRVYTGKGSSMFWQYDNTTRQWALRYGEIKASEAKTWGQVTNENKAVNTANQAVEDVEAVQRGKTPRTLRSALDLSLAARDAKGLLGAPEAREDDEAPLVSSQRASARKIKEELVNELVSRQVILPQHGSFAAGEDWDDDFGDEDLRALDKGIDDAQDKSFKSGGTLDDITQPFDKRFMSKSATFIEEHEGSVPYLYDDSQPGAKPFVPGKSKGNPTVGIGFNVDRPDADKLLAKVGTSKAELLKGKQLNREQQVELLRLGMNESLGWLRKTFKDVKMDQHQWIALASLAYNSRWDKRGPTLIGPNLSRFIKNGEWAKAADEIRNRSNKTKNPGIQRRREDEARMFEGVFGR